MHRIGRYASLLNVYVREEKIREPVLKPIRWILVTMGKQESTRAFCIGYFYVFLWLLEDFISNGVHAYNFFTRSISDFMNSIRPSPRIKFFSSS